MLSVFARFWVKNGPFSLFSQRKTKILLRAVQSVQYFFENLFINIQNLIYGMSIALEVNELHTFERS